MPKNPLAGRRILFADDELHYIEALIAIAEADEVITMTCRNASKAINIVLTQKIDCLVIDVMMAPGPDLVGVDPQRAGLEAIKIIKAKKPDQAIVCLSVLTDQTEIDRLIRLGVIFLRKAETSLEKAWRLIGTKITGIYSI